MKHVFFFFAAPGAVPTALLGRSYPMLLRLFFFIQIRTHNGHFGSVQKTERNETEMLSQPINMLQLYPSILITADLPWPAA